MPSPRSTLGTACCRPCSIRTSMACGPKDSVASASSACSPIDRRSALCRRLRSRSCHFPKAFNLSAVPQAGSRSVFSSDSARGHQHCRLLSVTGSFQGTQPSYRIPLSTAASFSGSNSSTVKTSIAPTGASSLAVRVRSVFTISPRTRDRARRRDPRAAVTNRYIFSHDD